MSAKESKLFELRNEIDKKHRAINVNLADIRMLEARVKNIEAGGLAYDDVFGWLTDTDIKEIIERWKS